jgi:PPM family protein phosphatase
MAGDFRKLVFAQKTDRGLKREVNEDSCAFRLPEVETPAADLGALFLVADGIGGIGRGEEASHAAVETVLSTYYDPELEDDHPRERLLAAIQDANEAVRARARTLNLEMLGTTLAGVVILSDEKLYLFNVGDSRIYLLRGETIRQITADQSSIDTQDSFARAKLTAFVGQFQPLLPQILEYDLQKDDTLLICSDGLWGLVEDHEIAAVVQRYPPQKAVDVLIQKVYERGARDNVTITIIRNGQRASRRAVFLTLLVLAAIIGILALATPLLMPSAVDDTALHAAASLTSPMSEAGTFAPVTQTAKATESQGQLIIRTEVSPVHNDK